MLEHKGTVRLETERLRLRPFTEADLEQIYNNCWSDYDIWKWTNYKPMKNIEEVVTVAEMFTEKWLGAYESPKRYSWAIALKSSGEVIGRIGGMNLYEPLCQIELAYEIGQKWWNQGLMTEAVKKVIDFFICEVGFNRVYAQHAHKNPASGRVMQKSGMTYEGTLRQGVRNNQGVFDGVYYSMLAEEYLKGVTMIAIK